MLEFIEIVFVFVFFMQTRNYVLCAKSPFARATGVLKQQQHIVW